MNDNTRKTMHRMLTESSREIGPLYHISNRRFRKFNSKKTAQGLIWFAKNRTALLADLKGASIRSDMPVYLYTCTAMLDKMAGWPEYSKLGLWELERDGFDSADLDGDVMVMDDKKIRIDSVEKVTLK